MSGYPKIMRHCKFHAGLVCLVCSLSVIGHRSAPFSCDLGQNGIRKCPLMNLIAKNVKRFLIGEKRSPSTHTFSAHSHTRAHTHTHCVIRQEEKQTRGREITPFEKNIEVWRQLWRVVCSCPSLLRLFSSVLLCSVV